MKRLGVALSTLALLVLLLAAPADAWRGGGRGGGWRGGGHTRVWHGSRQRGCCWHGGRFGGGFAFGFATGAILGAPVWTAPAYAYPAHAYPAYGGYYAVPGYDPAYGVSAYPAPGWASPSTAITYPSPPPPPPPSFPTPTPEPLSTPPAAETGPESAPKAAGPGPAARTCQMVLVEGHYETGVSAGGQRASAWIPAYYQQLCQ